MYVLFVLNQHQQFTSYIVNRLKLVGWVTTKLFFYKIFFIRGHKCHVMQKVISAVFAMAMQWHKPLLSKQNWFTGVSTDYKIKK